MPKLTRSRKKTKEKPGKIISRIEASAEVSPLPRNSAVPNYMSVQLPDGRWIATEVRKSTAAICDTKKEAEDAVRRNARRQEPSYDFYTTVSAATLARSQGVSSIRRLGQIRTFSNADPKEAELFVREVRRWRREDRSGRRTA